MLANIFTLCSRQFGNKRSVLLVLGEKKFTLKVGYISCATITSKANMDPNYRRKPPFPYKEKNYSMVRSWIDRTSERFDDNSKIIVVDGPVAVGKTNFAKELADAFDMHFVPEANMDQVYINSYGFDERSLNDQLPPNIKRMDEKDFCRDPFQWNTASLQMALFELRLKNYMDALAHLMNTGNLWF